MYTQWDIKQFYFTWSSCLVKATEFLTTRMLLLLDTFASGMNNQGYCEYCN